MRKMNWALMCRTDWKGMRAKSGRRVNRLYQTCRKEVKILNEGCSGETRKTGQRALFNQENPQRRGEIIS